MKIILQTAKNIKFKKLNYRELKVSLERLIRFNSPFEKLERVYREILIRRTIEPKINSRNFWDQDLSQINQFFQHIWNESVTASGGEEPENYNLNLYLAFEELKEFSVEKFLKSLVVSGKLGAYNQEKYSLESLDFSDSKNLQKTEDLFRHAGLLNTEVLDCLQGFSGVEKMFIAYRMNFPPNISGVLGIINKNNDLSVNAKRLLWLDELICQRNLSINDPALRDKLEDLYKHARKNREENDSLFPIELIVLVEGITEEILLPVFSKFAGIDFEKSGVKIVSSGGKNQVLKLYKKLSKEVKLPIFMLFDADAIEEAGIIEDKLRKIDNLYILPDGEFEDILPDKLICKAVNVHYRLTGKINLEEIKDSEKKSHTLAELWKQKGFGEFKKAEFAKIIANNVSKRSDLSEELLTIFEKIKKGLI